MRTGVPNVCRNTWEQRGGYKRPPDSTASNLSLWIETIVQDPDYIFSVDCLGHIMEWFDKQVGVGA